MSELCADRIIGPVCKTCKHYKPCTTRWDIFKIRTEMACEHPLIQVSDPFENGWLKMDENDFCSRWEAKDKDHGHWITVNSFMLASEITYCSVCHIQIKPRDYQDECPGCHAIMDEPIEDRTMEE